MGQLLAHRHSLKAKNPTAFTLIELIVVIVLIGILAAIAAVAYNFFIERANLSAKESTATQTAKLIQSQSAQDQSVTCFMDAARSPSGSQMGFTELNFASDIPSDVTTLNMAACNLSVVFDDGTVCSGVTFPPAAPGASYSGSWTCGDLALAAGSESVTASAGDGTLVVSWTAPTDNGGSGVIEYTATTDPGGFSCTVPAPSTTCTISGLSNGTPYTTTVTARTVAGVGEVSSISSPATPVGAPAPPAGASLSAVPGGLTASWTAPSSDGGSPITSYTATTNSGESCTTAAPTTSCEITGLDYTLSYTFTVTATNAGGTSTASAPSPALNPGAPFNSATCTGCITVDVPNYNGTGETWRVHSFEPGSGSLNVTASATTFRVLWAGGGGQSAGFSSYHGGWGGGGGAGRLVIDDNRTIATGTYSVVVGAASQETTFDGQNAPAGGSGGGMVLGRGGDGGSSGGGGGCHCTVSSDNSGTPIPASPLPGLGSSGTKGNIGVSSGYGGGAGGSTAGVESDITGSAVEYSRGASPSQTGGATPGSSGLSPAPGVVIVAYQLP